MLKLTSWKLHCGGNTTIAHASHFCGGDLESGAVWKNPDDSA